MKRLGVSSAIINGEHIRGDIAVEDGRIAEVGLPPTSSDLIAAPGFVDLQVNGFGGVDFNDATPEELAEGTRHLLSHGITSFLANVTTAPIDTMVTSIDKVREAASRTDVGSTILGVHAEGPYLSPSRPGAHPIKDLASPDPEGFGKLLGTAFVRMVTIAPELPRADELIELAVNAGVVVSLGHSVANASQAHRAFDAGAKTVTHLFNAMEPIIGRDPSLAGAALTRDDVTIQLIADGIHLDETTVRLAWAAAGGRIALVSDAIVAPSPEPRRLELRGYEITVDGHRVMLANGTLAGSAATAPHGVRTLVAAGVPAFDAIAAATEIPAKLIGQPEIGVLKVGGTADIVILDAELEVQKVFKGGVEA